MCRDSLILKIIFILVILIQTTYAEVWKDGEFLIWNYGREYISASDFCFALKYENEKIGNPSCRQAGELERDSTVNLYAKWLNANLDSRLSTEDLRPRGQYMQEKLRTLKDQNLIYSTIKENQVWILLFDETSTEPKQIANFSLQEDSAKVARQLANDWFGTTPEIRLSDEDREKKRLEPDNYFDEQPLNDFWIGVGAGFSDYKSNRDTSSAWRYLKPYSPIYSVYVGASLFDFVGAELEVKRSEYKEKIATDNKFERWEVLLSLEFMTVFKPIQQIEFEPHASVGFIPISFFSENHGIKFEDSYSGGTLAVGLRTAIFKNYALDVKGGLSYRGVLGAQDEVVAASTTDAFISAGLEYHIRWK
jgi:hypothetical protein